MPSLMSDTRPLQRPVSIAPVVQMPLSARARIGAGVAGSRVSCAACAMRNCCIPADFDAAETARLETFIQVRRRIRRGQHLFRHGEAAASLFFIRSGFMKTSVVTDDGREQVTGFHMMGDLIGVDAIGGGACASNAIALEDTDVCEIPLAVIGELAHEMPALQRKLHRMIGQEIRRQREAMVMLGTMRAEERIAAFLLDLGQRYQARGFSALRFLLRMSRADIGSYLGLRLETVSRLFSRFQTEGLLRVDSKSVQILDAHQLKCVIGQTLN
jgi:CRP/FNR family transcriptional regulator